MEVVASDKRGRKFLLYVLGIAVFILLLPMIVIVGLFGFLGGGGAVTVDQGTVLSHFSEEQETEISRIKEVCETISDTFLAYGLTDNDSRKAQTVYTSYLDGRESEEGFYGKLAECFTGVDDSTSVYDLLGKTFGIAITEDEQQGLDDRFGVTEMPKEGET